MQDSDHGLPGAGETTRANALAPLLYAVVYKADAMRANLSRDLVLATGTVLGMPVAWAGRVTALSRHAAP